jgi:hypothetical protein
LLRASASPSPASESAGTRNGASRSKELPVYEKTLRRDEALTLVVLLRKVALEEYDATENAGSDCERGRRGSKLPFTTPSALRDATEEGGRSNARPAQETNVQIAPQTCAGSPVASSSVFVNSSVFGFFSRRENRGGGRRTVVLSLEGADVGFVNLLRARERKDERCGWATGKGTEINEGKKEDVRGRQGHRVDPRRSTAHWKGELGREESAGKTDHDCAEKEKSAFDRLQSEKREGPTVHTSDQNEEEAQEDSVLDDVCVVGDASERVSFPPSYHLDEEETHTATAKTPQ